MFNSSKQKNKKKQKTEKNIIPFSKHILDMSAVCVEHSRKQEKDNQIFTLKNKTQITSFYHTKYSNAQN